MHCLHLGNYFAKCTESGTRKVIVFLSVLVQVYIKKIKNFALKFSSNDKQLICARFKISITIIEVALFG